MRVIAGTYKGRRLKGPTGQDVRPTGDRLKESLFNILGPSIAGSVVVDVFGGTGAIGIEALSRGAREAVFIENARSSNKLIRQNLEICGIKKGYRMIEQDAFTALRSLAREGFKADIVFFDPPYDWEPYDDLLNITFGRNLLSDRARVIIEHHRNSPVPESGSGYRRSRLVRQGDHYLSFFEPSADELRMTNNE